MTALLRLCLLAWLAFGTTGWSGGFKEEIAPGVWLVASDFGVWSSRLSNAKFRSTRTVAHTPGQQFGWRLLLRTQEDTLKLRIALTLPAPPKVWMRFGEVVEKDISKDGCMKISADRRTATIDDEYSTRDPWLMNMWTVAEGDPAGPHVLRLYLGGKLIRIFRFELVPPPPAMPK